MEGKPISIVPYALVCDVPAKSFLLKIKAHNAYNSCTKCTIYGEHSKRRVCFPSPAIMPTERTDDSLHNMMDRDFQNGETIMREIPNFGLVSNLPLDTMHLVFLGVVKKLLNLWHCGPLNVRLSTNLINQI